MLLLLLLSEACLVIITITTTQVVMLLYQSQCQRISNENWSHGSSESVRTCSEFPYLEPRRHDLLLLLTHCSWNTTSLLSGSQKLGEWRVESERRSERPGTNPAQPAGDVTVDFWNKKEQSRTKKTVPLFRAWPPHPINTIILALLFYRAPTSTNLDKNNGSAALQIACCSKFCQSCVAPFLASSSA